VILVVGGTGDLGERVVRRVIERGEAVRSMVRTSTDDSRLREMGAEVVPGDLTDPPSLAGACAGAGTVILTATAIARRFAGSSPSIHEVDEVGGIALVAAAESAGVQRFVYVSFVGVDAAIGTPLEHAKLAVEDRLRSSSMRSVIVRADAFQEIHLGQLARFDIINGKVSVIGRGNSKRRWIATEDVAALVAAVAVEQDPPAVLEVGGPEAISKNDLITLAEGVTGRRFKRQHMPRPVARLAIRLLSGRKDALASAFGAGLLQDLVEASWDDTPLRERGIVPTSASDFVKAEAEASTTGTPRP
jgi:uncharacterized protein YbjT (DUF2867 family)